jgi:peptidoglycan/LPS O-acetylase OafA/YrhL
MNMRRATGRILELDGLRGVAILLVLVWHYIAVLAKVPHRSRVAYGVATLRLTWSGVDLFFVLSGFLIGGILLDSRRSPRYFATFYRRRFFRIVPLYAALCVLFAIAVVSGGARWGAAGHYLFANPLPWYAFPLFLQNAFIAHRGNFDPLALGVTWSLAIEEQFYLTLPLLVRFLPPRRLLGVLVAIVATAPVLRAVAFYCLPHGGVTAYVATPMRADSLLAGVLSAILVRSPRAWEALLRRRKSIKVAVGFLAAGALCAMLLGHSNHDSAVISIVGYTWLALLYALVLLLAVSGPSGRLSRLLRARWLRALGEIAFGTYLLHIAMVGICFGVIFGSEPQLTNVAELGVILLALVLTIGVAQTSWALFEKRMVRIGQRATYGEPSGALGQPEPRPQLAALP